MDNELRNLQRRAVSGDPDAQAELERKAKRALGGGAYVFTGPVKRPEVVPVKLPREVRGVDPAHGGRWNYEAVKSHKNSRSRGRRRGGKAFCRNWEELY
jgi:hypothetical protein